MKILLVCGGGASSSFLAQNMTKFARSTNKDVQVHAIGETELDDYLNDVSLVMIGPHLKYLENDLKEVVSEYNIPYVFIPSEYYASINGEKTLELALSVLEREK